MIKKIAWNTFKKTGDINTMMELIEVEKIQKDEINDLMNEDISVENKYIKNLRSRDDSIGLE